MPRPISVRIDPSALAHNFAQVSHRAQQAYAGHGLVPPRFWAVIKANAYGHGIAPAVHAFQAADGLAMLDLHEAIQCREQGWTKPLLLLEGIFSAADAELAAHYGLTIVVHTAEQLQWLQHTKLSQPLPAFIKLNTGMQRLGFDASDFAIAFQQAKALQQQATLGDLGVMTHFARADEDPSTTQQQMAHFNQYAAPHSSWQSVGNSAATLNTDFPQWLQPNVQYWLRPGICLYGSSPFIDLPAETLRLQPAQTLEAELIAVQHLKAGDQVGYGHTFTATQSMRLGVVACGYADGYPRHAPNGTPVVVGGIRTQLVGRVSMDMLTVDLSAIPHAQVGTKVVLWGHGGPSVDEVAQASGTLGYELLCAVAPRVPRFVLAEDNHEK